MRKKLSELGIPNGGPKDLLIRRHIEWVNLVNANCDSLKPKTKRELIHELESWDRTQGRQILNNCNGASSASSVMSKNFDGALWASNHGNDYQSLIAQARRQVKPKVESISTTSDAASPMFDRITRNEYWTTSPNHDSPENVCSRNYSRTKEGMNLLNNSQSPDTIADLGVGD